MRARSYVVSILFVAALVAASVAGFLFWNLRPQLGLDLVGGVSVVLTAPPGTDQQVLEKTLETIRERVDAVGVAEPDITLQGEDNIQVQIPEFGGASQQRLLQLIGRTARLEFREVKRTITPDSPQYQEALTEIPEEDPPENEDVVFPDVAGTVPVEGQPDPDDPAVLYRLGEVLLTGDALSDANAQFVDPAPAQDPASAGWSVQFTVESESVDRFEEVTTDLQGKQMAIVLDRQVQSAPTIQEAIRRQGQITLGNGLAPDAEQQARDLALVLRTGALPVELERSEVQTVSATLGEESLRQGLAAGIAGVIALALYLFFYYRLLGIVTWLGMAVWAVLALSLVAVLGRTLGYSLTLAGVAGIVISLGITADSYIVFYERLKDEVRKGKTVRAAVGPAFSRAWRTIIAADIVTILAAVVLYILAIGSVRGFAFTLGLSTLLDMFVVYFFKRPTVFLIARSRALSEWRGIGLRSGVAVAGPEPRPVRGGSE